MPQIDQIERWAKNVRTHKDWKKIHTEFINAQYQKFDDFLKTIEKQPNGQKKIKSLYSRNTTK